MITVFFLDFSTISKQQQEACTHFHGGVSHAILYSESERFQVFCTVTPPLSKCHYNIKTAVCPCFLLQSSFSINARMDSSEKNTIYFLSERFCHLHASFMRQILQCRLLFVFGFHRTQKSMRFSSMSMYIL